MTVEGRGLACSVAFDDETAVVVLSGELDMARVEEFEGAIARAEDTDCPALVVDLSGLGFMDSSGLRALVRARQAAQDAGRRFMIVPGSEPVRRMFAVTRMDRYFQMIDAAPGLNGG